MWLSQSAAVADKKYHAAAFPVAEENESWRRTDPEDFDPKRFEKQNELVRLSKEQLRVLFLEEHPFAESMVSDHLVYAWDGRSMVSIGDEAADPKEVEIFLGTEGGEVFSSDFLRSHFEDSREFFVSELFSEFQKSRPEALVYAKVLKGQQVEKVLQFYFPNQTSQGVITVLLELGERASLSYSEYCSVQASGAQILSRYRLGSGARLICSNQLTSKQERCKVLQHVDISLADRADLNATFSWSGIKLLRSVVSTQLEGEGAHCSVQGIAVGTGRQHLDLEPIQRHIAPRTSGTMLFKTVLADQARAIFQGDITVERTAQKSDAIQTNKNLLLSPKARMDSLPKLNILPDDVKCKHGAATGQLDPMQIYYLMARGFDRAQATRLILRGFFAELIYKIPEGVLRDSLEAHLLSLSEEFVGHLKDQSQ